MEHHFNTFIAQKYGINEAILIHNFYYWTKKNKANGTHLRDGKYWTYNSIAALQELFPYLSERQINYALEKLVTQGVLYKGNYNNAKYDRTLWYALDETIEEYYLPRIPQLPPEPEKQNCQIHFTPVSNGFYTIVKPIPDINTYSNNTLPAGEPLPVTEIKEENTGPGLDEILDAAKKELKKKQGINLAWPRYVAAWNSFYTERIKTEPVITPRELKSLKLIVDILEKRALKKSNHWTTEEFISRFTSFLATAYSKDDWIKNNFSLSIIYNQINSIIKLAENGATVTAKKQQPSGLGKASGAVAFAERIRGNTNQD